jgi:hypothetical protein
MGKNIFILSFLFMQLNCAFINKENEKDWERAIELHKENFKDGAKFIFKNDGRTIIKDISDSDFLPKTAGLFQVYMDYPLTKEQLASEGVNFPTDALKFLYPVILNISEKKGKLEIIKGKEQFEYLVSYKKNKKVVSSKIACSLTKKIKLQDFDENKIPDFLFLILFNKSNEQDKQRKEFEKYSKDVTISNATDKFNSCQTDFEMEDDKKSCSLFRLMLMNISIFYKNNYDLPVFDCLL